MRVKLTVPVKFTVPHRIMQARPYFSCIVDENMVMDHGH
jgi:hypothetical protein